MLDAIQPRVFLEPVARALAVFERNRYLLG